jgi:ABC-type lipoprotein export system ATPase subunit
LNQELDTAIVIVTHDSKIAESMDVTYTLEDGMLSRT